jgi:hypothetical protein
LNSDVRFFTIDWWRGDDERDPFPEYHAHFERIREHLPGGLIQLHDSVSLHDAWLRQLTVNVPASTVDIRLEADDGSGGLRQIHLAYSEVTSFASNAQHEEGLAGPRGYGDLGYDEVDIVGDAFVHRMLFSGNIEMEIRFREFTLNYKDLHANQSNKAVNPSGGLGGF